MKYCNVAIAGFAAVLPEEVITTDEIEKQLTPLYERLKLPYDRIEKFTGIQERRLWKRGTTPGQQSIKTVEKLLEQTQFDRKKIGALIHASVCRDQLEPATACSVHDALNLPGECFVYDISNACLGILNGIIQIADMIELGHIEAGIVVGTEDSRSLMESTIKELNLDTSLTRKSVKSAFASLTIGSGSAAVLLTDRGMQCSGISRLLGGSVFSQTQWCNLCKGGTLTKEQDMQYSGVSLGVLMHTDSKTLMDEGVAAAEKCFEQFLSETGWQRQDIHRTFCHQVGRAHQRLLFDRLKLPDELNFSTLETLGNTGSTALPTAAALGWERLTDADKNIALLGIGSGINVVMLGICRC